MINDNSLNTTGSLLGTQSSSSGQLNSANSLSQFGINLGAPPAPPNLTALQKAGDPSVLNAQIQNAMGNYDKLSASTQAQGFQAANNAGSTYASRLMSQGINPVASGVVAAQAKLPVYKQLAQINADKTNTQLDYQVKAQSLQTQVQQAIAQLQLGYSQTLADYNVHSAQVQLSAADLASKNSQFNQTFASQNQQYQQDYGLKSRSLDLQSQLQAAQIANLHTQNQAMQQQLPIQSAVGNRIMSSLSNSNPYFQYILDPGASMDSNAIAAQWRMGN